MTARLNNVMVDIETLDTEDGAVILSLGAVQFDGNTGETGREFYQKISLQDSLNHGFTISEETLKWWLKKDLNVFTEALSGTKPMLEVLGEFSSFLNLIGLQYDKVFVWGNPARFDFGIIAKAYKKLNIPIPWDTWLELCFRTFIKDHKELRKSIPFLGDKHKPVDDCKHQISVVVAINRLNNNKMNKLTFGQALEAVKQGKLIAREGWNGKGMFVFQRPEDELTPEVVVNSVKSLPRAVKDWVYNNGPMVPLAERTGNIKFTAYLCMKAADNTIVNGWLASQTDMLADDWTVLE